MVDVLGLARLNCLPFFLMASLAEALGEFLAAHEACARREQTRPRRTKRAHLAHRQITQRTLGGISHGFGNGRSSLDHGQTLHGHQGEISQDFSNGRASLGRGHALHGHQGVFSQGSRESLGLLVIRQSHERGPFELLQ